MSEARAHTETQPDAQSRLLDMAGISADRLSMLQVIFERIATSCADSLRQMTPTPAYFVVDQIRSGRIGDLFESHVSGVIAAVFHAREWDSRIVVGLDRTFVCTLTELLLGGDGSEPPHQDDRAFSNIEVRLAQAIFEQIVRVMQTSFVSNVEAPFKLERTETRMDFATLGRRNNVAVVAKIMLQALGRGGEMFIVIPQSALNPMRHSLARAMSGETATADPRWTRQIQSEVTRTEVEVRAILDERQITLGELAELMVGQVLPLKATPRSHIKLKSNDQSLFWCQLGQAEGLYTVRVEDVIDQEQEFIGDILPH